MIHPKLIIPLAALGDIAVLCLGLLLSLFVRSRALPQAEFLATHAAPFILVVVSSLMVFYISSLYDTHQINQKRKLLGNIVYAQIANAMLAVLFFYFISFWGITPKTILVLYVIISSILLSIWRGFVLPGLIDNTKKIEAVLVAEGKEGEILEEVLRHKTPYPLQVHNSFFINKDTKVADLHNFFDKYIKGKEDVVLIIDTRLSITRDVVDTLYALAGKGIQILPFVNVYEDVFSKIPESSLDEGNVLEYMYGKIRGYAMIKRIMDLVIALPILIVSLLLYPFVYLAIKLEDGGPIYFVHARVGMGGKKIMLYKFRSMTFGDTSARWVKDESNPNKVTRVGKFLRKSRIDELPQLWNVVKGDISLIGPRPDVWSLGEKVSGSISFYNARLLVPPGLSGWAQTHMHTPPQTIEETKERLLYDLYYVKNASFVLDILTALKTVRTLLSREGM